MKAEMSEDGVITIRPESSIEAYALDQWSMSAMVRQDDLQRMEAYHWRGSFIIVDTNYLPSGTKS